MTAPHALNALGVQVRGALPPVTLGSHCFHDVIDASSGISIKCPVRLFTFRCLCRLFLTQRAMSIKYSIALLAALAGAVSSQIITDPTWVDTGDTLQLSADPTFHFSLLTILGMPGASDPADILGAANAIVPGDFTSWNSTFAAIAARKQGLGLAAQSKVNARETLFQAASYWRTADVYLHGNSNDPLINS